MAGDYQQQEIDAHILKINIDGEDIQISQGDLRNLMAKRRKELEQRRSQLAGNLPREYKESPGPDFRGMKPVFAEVLTASNGAFCVLIVDQAGRCATIAVGDGFSEKR